MGRPSSYSPDLCELAHNYCLLGATNDELAAFFGVSPRTIDNWIAGHPEFETAVKDGRVIADARVARGLYTRAIGYDRKVEREILHQGELRTVTNVTHYPPNPQACIFAAQSPPPHLARGAQRSLNPPDRPHRPARCRRRKRETS